MVDNIIWFTSDEFHLKDAKFVVYCIEFVHHCFQSLIFLQGSRMRCCFSSFETVCESHVKNDLPDQVSVWQELVAQVEMC
jgi:hypothetical protein